MNDDVLRRILEYTCDMQARRNVRPLQANLAFGEESTVFDFQEKIMTVNGIIGSEETILVNDVTFTKSEGCDVRPVWASEMVETVGDTHGADLCVIDLIGDGGGEYDNERTQYDHGYSDVPMLLPCLKWGWRKRVSYSIRLSHMMSVSVAIDILIVPTSWWVWDCEGMFWVIQILDASKPVPNMMKSDLYHCGYRVVGWASAQKENPNNED